MGLEGWLVARAFSPLPSSQQAHIPAISSSGASAGSTSGLKSPPGHRDNQHQVALPCSFPTGVPPAQLTRSQLSCLLPPCLFPTLPQHRLGIGYPCLVCHLQPDFLVRTLASRAETSIQPSIMVPSQGRGWRDGHIESLAPVLYLAVGLYLLKSSLEMDSRDCDNRKADMQLPSMTHPSEPGPLLDTSIHQTHVAFLSDQVALIEPRR